MILNKKYIGNWGEENGIKLLKKNGFTDVIDLNKIIHNFPVFDLLAKKDDIWYAFSSKTRNKYQPCNGKLNRQYNIFANGKKSKHKLDKASSLLKDKYGIHEYKKYWIACPIDYDVPYQTFYYGNFEDIPNWNTLIKDDGYVGIKMNEEVLKTYLILGNIVLN